MSGAERRHGIVRENSLAFAMQTAMPEEDPMAILARAQLYEEYILSTASVHLNRDEPTNDGPKRIRDLLKRLHLPLFE